MIARQIEGREWMYFFIGWEGKEENKAQPFWRKTYESLIIRVLGEI